MSFLHNEIDYRLAVGDGCSPKNREGMIGHIHGINQADQAALVEWIDYRFNPVTKQHVYTMSGRQEWIELAHLTYQPTPEKVAIRSKEIKGEWDEMQEIHRRGLNCSDDLAVDIQSSINMGHYRHHGKQFSIANRNDY